MREPELKEPASSYSVSHGRRLSAELLVIATLLCPSKSDAQQASTSPEADRIEIMKQGLGNLQAEVLKRQEHMRVETRKRLEDVFKVLLNGPCPAKFVDNPPVVPIGSECGFTIRFRNLPKGIDAMFNGGSRSMALQETEDLTSLEGQLNVLHEGMHILHDDTMRKIGRPRYAATWNTSWAGPFKKVAIMENEIESMGMTIEVINARLDGLLAGQNATFDKYKARVMSDEKFVAAMPNERWRLIYTKLAWYFYNVPMEFNDFVESLYCAPAVLVLEPDLKPNSHGHCK